MLAVVTVGLSAASAATDVEDSAHTAAAARRLTDHAAARTPAATTRGYADQVHDFINAQRRAHGLQPLGNSSRADAIAEYRAHYLARTGQFYHLPLGPVRRKTNASYAGEVLARGQITPKRTVALWMHSPSHREVLMSPHPNKVGVGVALTPDGQWLSAAQLIRT